MKPSIKARLTAMLVKSARPYRIVLRTEGDPVSVEEMRLAGELGEAPGVKIIFLTVPRRPLEKMTIQ